MKNICIIPAKGKSARLPGKNIREFQGKPIIAYSIEAALKSGLFDTVSVSTDSVEVANVASRRGASIIWRTDPLVNEMGTQALMQRHLKDFADGGLYYSYAVCLYPVAPLVEPRDFWRALHFIGRAEWSYVYGSHVQHGPDDGQLYFGRAIDFLEGLPFHIEESVGMAIDGAVDVNTQEDWDLLERNYKDLHP